MAQTTYGFGVRVGMTYEDAVSPTKELLPAEGFGVLAEIDVQKTMKQKLGAEFRKYVIPGACNPPLALQAFRAELDIGLLLTCNVVYEEDGGSVVSIMDPIAALGVVGNERLKPIADEARPRLERAIQNLSQPRQRLSTGFGLVRRDEDASARPWRTGYMTA